MGSAGTEKPMEMTNSGRSGGRPFALQQTFGRLFDHLVGD